MRLRTGLRAWTVATSQIFPLRLPRRPSRHPHLVARISLELARGRLNRAAGFYRDYAAR